MNFVYILYSDKLKKFYTGYTADVFARLKQHNSGETPYTSRGKPWELVYYAWFPTKKDALEEEKFLKSGKGRERRSFLLKSWIENKVEGCQSG